MAGSRSGKREGGEGSGVVPGKRVGQGGGVVGTTEGHSVSIEVQQTAESWQGGGRYRARERDEDQPANDDVGLLAVEAVAARHDVRQRSELRGPEAIRAILLRDSLCLLGGLCSQSKAARHDTRQRPELRWSEVTRAILLGDSLQLRHGLCCGKAAQARETRKRPVHRGVRGRLWAAMCCNRGCGCF